jgi:hypothetical protein
MLVGAAALSGNATAGEAPGTELLKLCLELERLRRRSACLQRRVARLAAAAESGIRECTVLANAEDHQQLTRIREGIGYDRAWEAWSTTVDQSLQVAARIRALPAHDLAGWSVKYRALLWELFEHDSSPSVSEHQLRLLRRLGSELQRIHP